MQPPSSPNVQAEENPKSLAGAWISTIIYCGFSFPFFLLAVFHIRDPMFIAISGFFAVFGVVYLVMTIRMTLGLGKFGNLRILIEKPPPAPGGRLTAAIFLPKGAAKLQSVKAVLTCYRVNAASAPREAMLAITRSVPVKPNVRGAIARIAIDIPADATPSAQPPGHAFTEDDPKDYYRWDLHVTAELPGVDLDRHFLIPVRAAKPVAAVAPSAESARKPETTATNPIRPMAALQAKAPQTAAALHSMARPAAQALAPPAAVAAVPAAPLEAAEPEIASDPSSTWLLVAVNLVPIAGVLFWNWHVRDVIFLYWIENLIIGAFNVLRIFCAVPDTSRAEARGVTMKRGEIFVGKAALAAFFVLHYGGFCYGHGEFLAGIFLEPGQRARDIGALFRELLSEHGAKLAVLAIAASHAYSFFRNYLGRGEFRGVDVGEMMFRPYKRVVVTHIFIMAGGFFLIATRNSLVAMVIFVALKIGFDVYFHRKEHAQKAIP